AKRLDPKDDVLSHLATGTIEGRPLTDTEFAATFFLFTVAGSDTTQSAIPGGLLALLEHPSEFDRLRRDPRLLPFAVEEMLRFAPTVIHFRRTATRDVEIGSRSIAEGDKVVVFYPSANRD